jgi:hypothetical protein
MPPRQDGLHWVPANDPGLTVGKVPVLGAGLRVGILCDGRLVHFSPAGARRHASDWETPEAKASDLEWVAEAMRQCADEIEALTATKQ